MTASGISKAIDELGGADGVRAALADADQLEIFAEIEAGERELVADQPRAWSGKGRKPGARNRTTRDIVEFIQKTGRDPLVALAATVKMTPAELRRYWGIDDGHKAAEFWRKCVSDLAGYMHPRMPQAVVLANAPEFANIFLNFAWTPEPANGPPTLDGSAIEEGQRFQSLSDDIKAEVAWSQGRMNG